MKRVGNLYEKIFDMDNLIEAHKNASNQKGWYSEVKQVNQDLEEYLRLLQGMLINRTYKTSDYEVFQRKDGIKTRIIYKLPYFPDRICQWAVMQIIEPYFLRNFTSDTYSAIPDRGTHLCLKKLRKAISQDLEGTKYCLKMDVHHYYPSINHDILKDKFKRMFKDEKLLWLLFEIIDSVPPEEGIPIGNYLSQYCGNFYLSEFDHWLKETTFMFEGKPVKVKYYFRYMDDMVILSDSKEFLHYLRKEISVFLYTHLKLHLKDNWQVFPVQSRGIDFVGYRTFTEFTLVRKRTVKNMKKSVKVVSYKFNSGCEINYHDYCSVNSYRGCLIHANGYRLRRKYIDKIDVGLQQYHDNYLISSSTNKTKFESKLKKEKQLKY